MACEAFPNGVHAWTTKFGTDETYSPKKSSRLLQPPETELHSLGKWAATAQAYSASELTFPEKDKIIAISGMAQQLQGLWENEYCAGLW